MIRPSQGPEPTTRSSRNGHAARTNRFAALVAFFYITAILTLALIGGGQLYDWAYNRSFEGLMLTTSDVAPIAAGDQHGTPNLETVDPTQSSQERTAPQGEALAQGSTNGPINILLLGVDARADDDEPPRTDTLMLVSLNVQNRSLSLLSLPRDLWVPIPGYDQANKINTAYTIGESRRYPGGGAQLAKDTVSAFTGRPVHYYAWINFDGFIRMVDLIGGLDIYVPTAIYDDQYPTADYGYELFQIGAGSQHLDGETALKYARTRNADDDYSRSARQQAVIQAGLDQVLKAKMLPTLITRAPQLISTLWGSIRTDMPTGQIMSIANQIAQDPPQQIKTLVLDDRFGSETYSDFGAWILLPNRSKIRPELNRFFADSIQSNLAFVGSGNGVPGGDGSGFPMTTVDQHSVRVEILNGSGVPGLAARTQELLESHGWTVVAIGTADRMDYRRTLLINYGTAPALIEQLSTDLAIQPTVSKLSGLNKLNTIDLRVILGQDYTNNVLNQ